MADGEPTGTGVETSMDVDFTVTLIKKKAISWPARQIADNAGEDGEVVVADNGFFFLIAWELMSLVSYFLVVTEHEKADVRYAGFFYLIMTHVGMAFVVLTYLILFQTAGSFSFESFRHPSQSLPDGMRTLVFLAALIGFGTKAGIVPLQDEVDGLADLGEQAAGSYTRVHAVPTAESRRQVA